MEKKELTDFDFELKSNAINRWYVTYNHILEKAYEEIYKEINEIIQNIEDGTIINIDLCTITILYSDCVNVDAVKIEYDEELGRNNIILLDSDNSSNLIDIDDIIYSHDYIEIYHSLICAISSDKEKYLPNLK